MKKKRRSRSGDLTVSVVMRVHVNPGEENTASYSVEFDVDGPEAAVDIVCTAYGLGALNRGIDAFVASVARSIGPKSSAVVAGNVGRA